MYLQGKYLTEYKGKRDETVFIQRRVVLCDLQQLEVIEIKRYFIVFVQMKCAGDNKL